MLQLDHLQYDLHRALEEVTVHDHLCLIYYTRSEQLAAALPFIQIGLERNEQCMYIADDNSAADIVTLMNEAKIDVNAHTRAGDLAVVTKQDAYLEQDRFDPDRMLNFLSEAVAAAKAAGYLALRVAGEMTWALSGDPGVERLIEYEARLNDLLPNQDIVALCQYDGCRFSPEIILGMIRTHPKIVAGGMVCRNPYYVPPEELLAPGTAGREAERLLANIVDRQRTEEALQESEDRFHSMFDNAAVGMALVDLEGYTVAVNEADARFLGYSTAELTGAHLGDLIHPADLELDSSLFQELIGGKRDSYVLEKRYIRKDGQVVWGRTNASLIRGSDGRPRYTVVVCEDITERKRAEENLRQRHRDLALLHRAGQVFISTRNTDQVLAVILEEVRAVLNVVACSAWLLDPISGDLVCRQVTNPHGERVRGWRLAPDRGLAGWVTQQGKGLIVPDAQIDRRHYKEIDRMTGLPLRSILTVPLKAGDAVIGVLQVVDTAVDRFTQSDLILLESLAATASVAVENARLYEEAERLRQQALQDAQTKSALVQEINHRVKNNLSAIMGLLYTAQRYADEEQQSLYQTLIENLVHRIHGLAAVYRLLALAEWQPLKLSEIVEHIVANVVQTLPRQKKVLITVSPSPVRVTPTQAHDLALVTNELAVNTVKHVLETNESVSITIHLSREEQDVICEFRDDGPGYPPRVLAGQDRRVGLNLAKNIVRLSLRGELTLFNDPGAVAIVRFRSVVKDDDD